MSFSCFSRQTDWAKILRIYSDEIYPWEAGKAPWSVEQGGTGTMPSGVKDKIKFRVVPGKGSGPGTYYSSFTCYFPSHDILARWNARELFTFRNDTPSMTAISWPFYQRLWEFLIVKIEIRSNNCNMI